MYCKWGKIILCHLESRGERWEDSHYIMSCSKMEENFKEVLDLTPQHTCFPTIDIYDKAKALSVFKKL